MKKLTSGWKIMKSNVTKLDRRLKWQTNILKAREKQSKIL